METTKKNFKFKKRDGIFLLLGIIAAFVLRFSLVDAQVVHYHANFALYIDGVRDEFKSPTFYEEIAACSAAHDTPQSRIHMHNNEFDAVHVHDGGATWGNLFANFSYSVSDGSLVTDKGLFVDGVDGKKLTFVLNGLPIRSIANRVVGSEDTLLVSYGKYDENDIKTQDASINKTAHELNQKPDPATCSGSAGESVSDRFKRTLGISQHN
jgi:hypothetical protein